MPREHSFGVRERAETLYLKGYTQAQVADLTGVSLPTIARWSSEAGWRDKRLDRRKKMTEINEEILNLRLSLVREAAESLNPMLAFAVGKMEALALKQGALNDTPLPDDIDDIKTAADAASALEQALRLKAGQIISQPETIDLAAINDLFKVWELLESMQKEAAPDDKADSTAVKKSLDPETLKKIREEVYGLV